MGDAVRAGVHDTVDVRGDPRLSPAELRAWAARVLRGLGEEHLHAVQLVLTELVTNADEHAGGLLAVRLRWRRSPCLVRVEADDGTSARPVPRTDGTGTRGRGLLLVDALAANWGASASAAGKTVHATIDCGQYPGVACPPLALAHGGA